MNALADDLNVSEAMAIVHAWICNPGSDSAEAYGVLLAIDRVLGVWELTQATNSSTNDQAEAIAASLCALIDKARRSRDFSAADIHRQRLIHLGYEVRSSCAGTTAKKKLA